MDVFTLFEQRTSEVIQRMPSPPMQATIPFKKVGKRAVKAMRKGAFVMDGQDAVPALYTVLVSPEDDRLIRRAYPRLTQELELLVSSQAEEREPLARFVIDDGLKPRQFDVIADNVDKRTLERLRQDEQHM